MNRGIYLLGPEHAEAIQRLAADPLIAATTRVPHPYPPDGALDFIEKSLAERAQGTGFVFVVKDGAELVGVVSLDGVDLHLARELGYWIGRPYWGRGYASFAAGMALQFAFQTLHLDEVRSGAVESNRASRRVLEKQGFIFQMLESHQDPLLKHPVERLARYSLTRQLWQEGRVSRATEGLPPSLKAIVAAELAAGNEIAESSTGWPDSGSHFIRLRDPSRTDPVDLGPDIVLTRHDQPHGWQADYSTRTMPRHILAW